MKKISQLISIGLLFFLTMSCQFSSKNLHQGITFDEPDAPQPVFPDQDWDKLEPGVQLAQGSINVPYHREYIPKTEPAGNFVCSGWKNERVYAQWEFDYEVLDNWIAFMMELGIDKQIN